MALSLSHTHTLSVTRGTRTEHFFSEGLFGVVDFLLKGYQKHVALELCSHSLLHIHFNPLGRLFNDCLLLQRLVKIPAEEEQEERERKPGWRGRATCMQVRVSKVWRAGPERDVAS